MEVFWGITASRSYVRTIPADRSVMLSAAGMWKPKTRTFIKKRVWPWRRWMLDSGGFTMFRRLGDFPWTPDEYLALVARDRPTLAASMDYPCEPALTQNISGMAVEDRVRATAEMALYLCRRSARIYPVLQGWSIADYELSWRLLEPLKPRFIGIGSLCVRQRDRRIAVLCAELDQILPAELWKHGFGVKLTALRHDVCRDFFTSIDTNAWEFHRRGRAWPGQKMPDVEAWLHYSRRLASLKDLPAQTRFRFSLT